MLRIVAYYKYEICKLWKISTGVWVMKWVRGGGEGFAF